MKKLLLALLFAPFAAFGSGIVGTLPSTITAGQVISAVPIMGNFNFIAAQVNANAASLNSANTFLGANTFITQAASDNSQLAATTAYVTTGVAAEAAIRSAADLLLAPLASPALTGIPTAPTPIAGTSTTQIATTAFVANNFIGGASPALTGTPTAPTAGSTTHTTQIATTAFVAGNTVYSTALTPLPGANTTVSYAHGLGVVPAKVVVEVVCLTAELGYAAGDVIEPFTESTAFPYPLTAARNSTTVFARTGNNVPWMVNSMTTGAQTALTAANWSYRFKIQVQ